MEDVYLATVVTAEDETFHFIFGESLSDEDVKIWLEESRPGIDVKTLKSVEVQKHDLIWPF
jgi:hypothetical protein